ncbi:MAG: DUF2437 domain-containing protein, partial [Thermomicrobia bacterium]|nr:DUF2437 domain-containing protein [Thermomicrobia bacterium]
MRFVRYAQGGTARYGVLDGDTVRSATGDPFA